MVLTSEKKREIINQFQTHKEDSGSSEVQVAILTKRISDLTAHLNKNPKDYQSQRGLLLAVGQRKALLKYIYKKDPTSHRRMLDKLEIRG